MALLVIVWPPNHAASQVLEVTAQLWSQHLYGVRLQDDANYMRRELGAKSMSCRPAQARRQPSTEVTAQLWSQHFYGEHLQVDAKYVRRKARCEIYFAA